MSPTLPRSLAAAASLASALLLGAPALAGTVQVRDGAGLLTPDQESALRAAGSRYAFDARVLTDTRFATRDAFERHVAAQLAGPTMVVVGIDPAHRWTAVHYGTSTRIATARFGAIENAGDPYFRAARWGDGVLSILDAAQSSVGSAPASGSQAPAFPWGVVIFGLVAVGGVALVSRLVRRTQRPEAPGYLPMDPARRYDAPPPSYGSPYGGYAPHAPYGPAGGGVGTGLAGAALGGLAGYALGNAMAHRDERDASRADVGGGSDEASSWDAGGSASGWDDGGGGGGDFGGGDGGGGDW